MKVVKLGDAPAQHPELTPCFLWTGAQGGSGYGIFGPGGRGVSPEGAHRMAWILAEGSIPAGMSVLHRCDVKLCVRRSHLFLGDQGVNMRDMYTKGRAGVHVAIGVRNGSAKLTDEAVRAIRQRRLNGETLVAIASDYGVTFGVIARAAKGHTWKHVR